jgi:hypothetical protein
VNESAPVSCDSNVRPVWWSVNRIGSRLVVSPSGQPFAAFAVTSVQVAVAGLTESSKCTLKVDNPAWKKADPVLKLFPIDGSPASSAPVKELGAAYVLKPGGVSVPGGGFAGMVAREAFAV